MIARVGAALAAVLLTVLAAAPAQARWLRAESPKFIVYSDGEEGGLRAYVQRLETFDIVLRHLHGLPENGAPPRKLELYLVKNHQRMTEVWPGLGEGIEGIYSSSPKMIFALALRLPPNHETASHAARRGVGEVDEDVVFHEYTHHFMKQYFPYGYPTWLVEGYAEYFASVDIEPTQVHVGKISVGREWELTNVRWVPIRDVLGKRLDQLPDGDQSTFYAEAWLLTHYLMSTPARTHQMRQFMLEVGKGADPVKAMEAATGQSAELLEASLRTYLAGKLMFQNLDRTRIVTAPVTVTELPASADEMLLPYLMVKKTGVPKKMEEEVVKRARADEARLAGDRWAELTLARAENYWGDRKVGIAVVDKWIAAHPEDVEALVVAAEARMDEGDKANEADRKRGLYKEAAPLLARAYKLDPNRYETLMEYTRSRQLLDADYPSDNTLEALLATLEFAPQVDEARIQAARGMMRRKRWTEATGILTPLANSPHGRGSAETARKLLKEIDGAKAKGA